MKTYAVNEIFRSVQGEGVRAGTVNLFLRFAHCNLKCRGEEVSLGVFQPCCDTEFSSYRDLTVDDILKELKGAGETSWVILTGGEPTLQLDDELVGALREAGYRLAIETNGLLPVHEGVDWVCVSPKTAEHTLRTFRVDELKYVRRKGQGIPRPSLKADHHLISPAFVGGILLKEDLNWCMDLVLQNPTWRLSLQLHQLIGAR